MRQDVKRDGGPVGGGGGGAADRQADSSAVTDDRATQRLARDSRPALSSLSKNKTQHNTTHWLLAACLQPSRPPGSAGSSAGPWGQHHSRTRVKNVEL